MRGVAMAPERGRSPSAAARSTVMLSNSPGRISVPTRCGRGPSALRSRHCAYAPLRLCVETAAQEGSLRLGRGCAEDVGEKVGQVLGLQGLFEAFGHER